MNGGWLYRIEQDKMLFGVSDGRADYFDIDVSLVRLGWVLLCIVSGGLLALAYLVMGLVTPTYFWLYGVEKMRSGWMRKSPPGTWRVRVITGKKTRVGSKPRGKAGGSAGKKGDRRAGTGVGWLTAAATAQGCSSGCCLWHSLESP
jgi:phage shock protein C